MDTDWLSPEITDDSEDDNDWVDERHYILDNHILQAVFRKFLSATKNKMKTPNIKYERDGGAGPATSNTVPETEDEELDRQRQEWQEELDTMSEFLVLKSTEEQKEEGAKNVVDTAYIDDRDGMPMLKAVFDVRHFKAEEIHLSIEDSQLTLDARTLDDRATAVFRKTMIRKIDLPKYVDPKMMHCQLSKDGLLTIEMPFHLPPQRKPAGPSVVPILTDVDGRRKIRLAFMVGTEFTNDDITVESNGKHLVIKASYDAEIGKYGQQVRQREMKKEFKLPDFIEVDTIYHSLSPDGRLFVEIVLKEEKAYKCEISTEEVETT